MVRTTAYLRMQDFQIVFTRNQFVDFGVAKRVVAIILGINEIGLNTAESLQLNARKLFRSVRPHLGVSFVVDHTSDCKKCE